MGKKVLAVIDDERVVREMMQELVGRHIPGVKVVLFSSGSAAVCALQQGAHFDAAVIDGLDGNGPYYARDILEINPNIRILGFSGSPSLKNAFLNNGAEDFIIKGGRIPELMNALKDLLGM